MRWSAVRLAALVAVTAIAVPLLLGSVSAEIGHGKANSNKIVPEKKTLNLAGIFPMHGTEGWQGGLACLPAALMAEEDVNAREDLLAGYTLHMTWNDSKCEPGLGARVMYDLLYNKPQKLMLIGGCSTVCTTIAEAARMWNLMVLSYGSSSPALSDRKRFPTFFRTHPSATVHNPTRIKLFQLYRWTRIAILQQAEEVFISTVKDMEERCKQAGIEILTRQSFLTDPAESVKNLRRPDARIVVGLFYVAAARRVLCDIYKQKMYGKSYVWLFIGWYEDNWFEVNLKEEGVNCTREQMAEAAEGHITTEALMWDHDNSTTISGMTAGDFERRLKARLNSSDRIPDGYQEAPLAYDAIWAIALALNKTANSLRSRGLYLENFTYTHKEIADAIKTAMEKTSFQGISGLVKFSTKGDRLARTQFEQLQDGKYVRLGYYDTNTDNFTQIANARWIGNKVPQDRTIVMVTLRTVSLTLFVLMCCLSLLGLVVAVGLLCFNYIYRERRLIRHSHPVGNDMTLVGISLCLLSVVLLGLDGRFIPENHYHVVCQARTWTLSIGFTLSFGAMFTKIWRVHRFATKAEEKIKVQPRRLYILVGCLLLVDVAFLLTWQIMDPLYRDIESFPLEDPHNTQEDIKFKPLLEHCHCRNITTWLGILYGFKGLLLIFGLFLAYETRSIKLKEINDSRLVGMSIYNVVVLCLITAPVSMVIGSQQDASFAFVALAIVFCCYISMGLIFFPKIMDVIQNPRERVDPAEEMPSREEEERYRKLLSENDELQRLIAEKEEKVRLLRQKLQERAAARTTGGAVVAAPALGLVAATRMLDPSQPLGGAAGPSASRRPSAADRRPSADRRPRVTVVCATPPPGEGDELLAVRRSASPRPETPDGPCFSIAVPRPGENSKGSSPSPEPRPGPATEGNASSEREPGQPSPVTNQSSQMTSRSSPTPKQTNSLPNQSSQVPLVTSPMSMVPSPVPGQLTPAHSHQEGLDTDPVSSPIASPVPPGISVLGIIAYTKGPRNPATGDFDPSESYL